MYLGIVVDHDGHYLKTLHIGAESGVDAAQHLRNYLEQLKQNQPSAGLHAILLDSTSLPFIGNPPEPRS
jgi:hypothetical protein